MIQEKIESLIRNKSSLDIDTIYHNYLKNKTFSAWKNNLEEEIKKVLNPNIIYSLSFSINTPKLRYTFNKNNCLYDIASITKFYTLSLLYILM